jgi:hypothetical protein
MPDILGGFKLKVVSWEKLQEVVEVLSSAIDALLKTILKGFTMQIISSTYWNL